MPATSTVRVIDPPSPRNRTTRLAHRWTSFKNRLVRSSNGFGMVTSTLKCMHLTRPREAPRPRRVTGRDGAAVTIVGTDAAPTDLSVD